MCRGLTGSQARSDWRIMGRFARVTDFEAGLEIERTVHAIALLSRAGRWVPSADGADNESFIAHTRTGGVSGLDGVSERLRRLKSYITN